MKQLGDITKIKGADVPPVDVVIGGSPCQNLSVAGNRKGLAGSESGLFYEQIRVIKELRDADRKRGKTGRDIRPRFMVWENVPGSFSSNKGADFRIVLEETARVADENANVPMPPGGQKWRNSGVILGDGWSIAWRVFDAQFWGVPQRRRRIALVADFGGSAAPEILFERKGVSRDSAESGEAREAATGSVGGSTNYPSENRVVCYDARGNGDGMIAPTMTGDHNGHVSDYTAIVMATGQTNAEILFDKSATLVAGHEHPIIATSFQNTGRGWWNQSDIGATLRTPCGGDSTKANVTLQNNIIRRLTPLECERLQGFPDGWCDINEYVTESGKKKTASDSAKYRALGNSIALPSWFWVLYRLCQQYDRKPTMASLFDGIGGFPLLWQYINGPGYCLWASEIEDFPMAVTAARFPEDEILHEE